MTPDRLAALQALFEAALEVAPADREAFLSAGAHDPSLAMEVRALLAASEATGDVFSKGLLAHLGWDALPAPSGLLGQDLGPYRVTREIGYGGMGTVYEAVRSDDQFTKRVAIKTLRGGGGAMLARFTRERQIQAALAHPNIAALLDAGVTGQGDPYIVLEFVDGLPIDAYCDTHRLGIPARLDLFRQVIQAVQHAHRQQVVHRDLKPSNILVTPDGVVKLLDFGISKLLSEGAELTATDGPRAFTTAFASPEQIRGELISTSSDIYSLGVILYRLLTGQHPYVVEPQSPAAAWTAICETTPPLPSTVAGDVAARAAGLPTAERLSRTLRGELDAIVLMALRKEPERRYPAVSALEEDIQSYLRGHPVSARPDTAGYRFRKLVRRNPLASAALALALAAMLGGTFVSLWQAREARAERATADQERRTAERVSEFLQDIFASADPGWGGRGLGANATIREAIDQAAARIDTDLAEEPAVAEALHRRMVSLYSALHRTEEGKFHAQRVLALQRMRQAPGPAIARTLHDISMLYRLESRLDSAAMHLEASYRLYEAAGFPETEDFAITLNEMALLDYVRGNVSAAEASLTRAVGIAERVGSDDRVLAIGNSNLGVMREGVGDVAGAEEALRKADFFHARASGGEAMERGVILANLAVNLTNQGRPEEAESLMVEARRVWDRTIGPDHPTQALGRFNMAKIQVALNRPERALEAIREGRQILRELPLDHPDQSRGDIQEAAALLALDRLVEAERVARRALATRRAAYGPSDWRLAEAEGTLGRVIAARGDLAEARTLLAQSHQRYRAVWGPEHPITQEIGRALLAAGAPPP